jgi:hypothetical protein
MGYLLSEFSVLSVAKKTNDGFVNWQDLMVLAENWLDGIAR